MQDLGQALAERPRRTLVLLLLVLALVFGGRAVLSAVTSGPPGNDQASLDQLRSQFAQRPWESSLISATWSSSGSLTAGLNSDDRRLALQACSDLIDIVHWRTSVGPSMGPDGAVYTYINDDGELFVLDRSSNVLVTNFRYLHSGCRWRLN